MDRLIGPLAMSLAATALASATPPAEPRYSAELLKLHDPTARLANLCGGKDGGAAMRAKLMIAAAVVEPASRADFPLYDGLGEVHFKVTTANPLAQRYFDQGLGFSFGFNHSAAIASFRMAQKIDPGCAMCWWGEALAHGPNINAPMDSDANARAIETARRAWDLAGNLAPAENALITAMQYRYSDKPEADRSALDATYADAMLAAARAHADTDLIALLAAEAAMDTRPWDYWTPDKKPQLRLGEAVQLVERVLARNPRHPQAAHLYIHLMENGPNPARAQGAADILAAPLAPTAGHLVHMPAHIYYRLGRWKDSVRVNIAAARADEAYLNASGDRGLYRFGYYPHNVHFILASAQMAGDGDTAMRESRRLSAVLDAGTSARIGWIQAVEAAPYFASAQFAAPADTLRMPEPDTRLTYVAAMRHYARAVAFAQLRDRSGFAAEIAAIRALRTNGDFKDMVDQGVPAPDLLRLAETVALGRWAYAAGNFSQAAQLYRQAIATEKTIPYMEPPYWYFPVQQSLGAALYRAGRHAEARKAFTFALAQSPNNGWALYGLAQSERALGRTLQAQAAEAALNRAWLGKKEILRMDRL